MIRVLIFFAILFALALGFARMADLPGTISVSWNGYVWEQTPVVAALVGGLLLVAFLAVVWIIRVVLKSPQIAGRFFRQRRKDKGYGALSQGLIALGTGNAKLARRHGLEADKLLGEEPAAKLLLAQTAQLAGKDAEARQRFEAMLEDPATKALGLHGLFVEAERQREPVAARHYAEEALRTSPGLDWAGKAVLGYQAVAHHWDEALQTLERNYAAKLLDKKAYRRQRAVILTALARKLEGGDPDRAFSLAKEAHGLALDLVPAAVITSRLATRRGDNRKAAKVLEATWRLSPHPELAETYAHVRTGDSAVDRLKRVKSLSAQRANTADGAMAIAKAALDAREFDEARTQLKKVLQSEPTQGAFLLMAEVEDAETGDKGRMRDWLARAVKAPRDKSWIANGVVSAEWQPVSPVTGKLDAFRWDMPGEVPDDQVTVLEDSLFEAPVLPAAAVPEPEPVAPADPKDITPPAPKQVDAATTGDDATKASETVAGPAPEASGPAAKSASSAPVAAEKMGYEGTTDDVRHAPPLSQLPDQPEASGGSQDKEAPAEPVTAANAGPSAASLEASREDAKPDAKQAAQTPPKHASAKDSSGDTAKGDGEDANGTPAAPDDKAAKETKPDTEADDLNRPIEFPLSRMPDDPGTDDDEPDGKSKTLRPRFFN